MSDFSVAPQTDTEVTAPASTSKKAPKAPKVYTITKTRRGKDRDTSGTIEELIKHFGNTLENGHSWNSKINRNPKTIVGLVSALNKSVAETQGACYDQDYYELKK